MNKVNEGLRIITEGAHTLAIDEAGNVNVEVSEHAQQPRSTSTLEFLCLAENLAATAKIAKALGIPLNEKWSDVQVVNADRPEYFRALRASGIAYRVLGDVGRRAAPGPGQFGRGEIDYRPGFWLHPELVLPRARWIAGRRVPPCKTPLIAFLEKHLPSAKSSQASAPAPVQEVTAAFAGEVSAKALEDLRIVDRLMMADGVSASERTEVLRARIESMQGA